MANEERKDSLKKLFEGYGKTMSLVEVAELLKTSKQTVSRMAKEGKIPAYKPSGQLLFIREDIEQYIRESRIKNTQK